MSLKIIIFCQSILYLHFSMQDKIKWSCAEYKLRKRTKKKNENKIYIIISYSVVVLAKLSEITHP